MYCHPTRALSLIILVLTVSATAGGAGARPPQSDVDEVKTIDVTASHYAFEPATISVVKGDRVRLRLRSTDRTHGIEIKAFRVKAVIPKTGEVATVEFVADRVGTYAITCSEYCGIGHAAMKGTLVVLGGEQRGAVSPFTLTTSQALPPHVTRPRKEQR